MRAAHRPPVLFAAGRSGHAAVRPACGRGRALVFMGRAKSRRISWDNSTQASCRSPRSSRTAPSCSTRRPRPAWWSIRAATSSGSSTSIRDNSFAISQIWITHGHIDHAGGAMDLKDALGVEIIGPHEADRPLLANLESQAQRFGLAGAVRNCTPDRFLSEGETVSFGEHVFEVLHCPGHAPGHVVYYNARRQIRACRRRAVPRLGRAHRPAGRRPCRADPLDQGEAAAARRRHRLHLRPWSGQPFRRRAARQSVSWCERTTKSAAIAGGALRGQGEDGVSSPRRNVPRRHSR